jgi:hypothetical protein
MIWIAVGCAGAPGCFFHLADPIEQTDAAVTAGSGGASGGTGGSSGGTGGSSGRDASSGGTNAGSGGGGTSGGSGGVDASTGGSAGDGGDGATRDAVSQSCEFPFLQDASASADSITASKYTPIVDGVDDWPSTIPWHPIVQTCDCTQQYPMDQVTDRFTVPLPDDLSARFRVAWDDNFLYVLAEVHDKDIVVAAPPQADAGGELPRALREDAVELMLNGDGPPSPDAGYIGYSSKAFQIFFGVDGTAEVMNQGSPIDMMNGNYFAVGMGTKCYAVEIKLTWSYLTGGTHGNAIGFTAAVDDWDSVQTAQNDGGDASLILKRQSHLFSNDPRDQYWNYTSGFGSLTLIH